MSISLSTQLIFLCYKCVHTQKYLFLIFSFFPPFCSFETNERLRVLITDSNSQRWEVPQDVIPRQDNLPHRYLPENHYNLLENHRIVQENFSIPESNLILAPDSTCPFGFSISLRSTGDILFDTSPEKSASGAGLVFKEQYTELSSALPVDRASLFGLGEHTEPAFRLRHDQTPDIVEFGHCELQS